MCLYNYRIKKVWFVKLFHTVESCRKHTHVKETEPWSSTGKHVLLIEPWHSSSTGITGIISMWIPYIEQSVYQPENKKNGYYLLRILTGFSHAQTADRKSCAIFVILLNHVFVCVPASPPYRLLRGICIFKVLSVTALTQTLPDMLTFHQKSSSVRLPFRVIVIGNKKLNIPPCIVTFRGPSVQSRIQLQGLHMAKHWL